MLPKCGAEACAFEESGVLECPFFSSGTYDTVEGDSCDDFMRVRLMTCHSRRLTAFSKSTIQMLADCPDILSR